MSTPYQVLSSYSSSTVQVLTMTHSSRAEAHHNRGAILLANEEYKKALIELNKAISIDPLDANFRHTRAWTLWRLKQSGQALDELKFAINLSSDSTLLNSLGSFLYMLGDYDEALRIFSKAISKASSSAEAALYLRKRGSAFLALNKIPFALLDLNKAIEIDPTDPHHYGARAEIFQSAALFQDAVNDCSRAISGVQNDASFYLRRGQCYFAQDKLSLALEDAQAALKIDENLAEAHLLLGKILLEDGQVSIAMQFFVSTFTFADHCAEAYLFMSLCFDLLKAPKEAHQYARKAAALEPAYRKYTLDTTRRNLISPNLSQRLQTFKANVHELYPELRLDRGEN